MSLSEDQERETARIAELEVRRYFDHYLINVFPLQVRAIKAHAHDQIDKHDGDRAAHGGVEKKVNRMWWGLIGVSTVLTVLATIVEIWRGR